MSRRGTVLAFCHFALGVHPARCVRCRRAHFARSLQAPRSKCQKANTVPVALCAVTVWRFTARTQRAKYAASATNTSHDAPMAVAANEMPPATGR